jgi:zinc D-Ala-D-Ala carboxypeptidase
VRIFLSFFLMLLCSSCLAKAQGVPTTSTVAMVVPSIDKHFSFTADSWHNFVGESNLPSAVQERLRQEPARFMELAHLMLQQEEILLVLVDKQHFLPASYAPSDLVAIDGLAWATVNRAGHTLRKEPLQALEQMSRAAKLDGVTIMISSTYRSYQRQEAVYANWVKQLGQVQADRLSAVAGSSQHQLGTVVDFGSINASFTGTRMQIWLANHAHLYGYSLSYPQGYESATGYDYESWHYRYLGLSALQMQRDFFDDLQYQLLYFWHYQQANLRKYYLE